MAAMHHSLYQIQFLSNNLRQILLFPFFILALHIASASEVVIIGSTDDYKNEEISLTHYSDYISFYERELASVIPDQSGNFTMKIDVQGTIQAFLKVQGDEFVIYLEPGKELRITVNIVKFPL